MATYRFCTVCESMHDVAAWPDNHREYVPDNRSDLAAPMIIRDEMDRPLQGQHNGQMFTSKRAMRQSYRDHGVTEVGDDKSFTHREHVRPQSVSEKKRHRAKARKGVEAAVGKALSRAGFGA